MDRESRTLAGTNRPDRLVATEGADVRFGAAPIVWSCRRSPVRHTIAVPLLCAGIVLFASGAQAAQQPAPNRDVAQAAAAPATSGRVRAIDRKTIADLPVWKRITVGSHRGVDELRDALDAARIHVGDSADEILGRPAFPFSRTRTDLDLVIVTAADLGFPAQRVALADIYARAGQLGLELCPAEAAPQLRLQYLDQPVGEFLRIAMRPVATYAGDLVDLTVANGGAGLVLIGGKTAPDLSLHASVKLVFVRPHRVASPYIME